MRDKVEARGKNRKEALDLIGEGVRTTMIASLVMGGLIGLVVQFTIGWWLMKNKNHNSKAPHRAIKNEEDSMMRAKAFIIFIPVLITFLL